MDEPKAPAEAAKPEPKKPVLNRRDVLAAATAAGVGVAAARLVLWANEPQFTPVPITGTQGNKTGLDWASPLQNEGAAVAHLLRRFTFGANDAELAQAQKDGYAKTVDRLINMGVETFLLTSSINLILAQRLVRKICDKCKEPIDIKPELLINLGVDAADIGAGFATFRGRGCNNCGGTGYRGRLAVYEVMVMHEAIRELILKGASAMELKREAVKLGMSTLRMSALQKVRDGMTTVDETIRVTDTDKGFGSVFSLGF